MELKLSQTFRMGRSVGLAAFFLVMMMLGAFWGCSDDALSSSETGNKNDVGVCKPNDTRMEDCNLCTCNGDGQWSCTEKACSDDAGADEGDVVDDDTTRQDQDADEVCAEGDTKSVDCNGCFCDGAGNWNCTELDCSIVEVCAGLTCGERCSTCVPGDGGECPAVVEYCNDDGQCTTETPECRDDGETCVEGATKKVDCNTCVCDGAGNWSCTKKGCVDLDPCAGKQCGDRCSTCEPGDDACLAVVEHCDMDGKCSAHGPSCGL